jgi:putative membrane protein
MRHRRLFPILVAVIVVAMVAVACHKENKEEVPVATATVVDTTPTSGTIATATIVLNSPDRQFVLDAGAAILAEIGFAKTADTQAVDVATKAFAHLLFYDLSNLNNELRDIAAKHGVEIPAVVDVGNANLNTALGKKKGKDFDQTFLKQIVDDHTAMIKLFDAESKVVADQALKDWVNKTIPTLQKNLDKAKELEAKIAKMKKY